MRATVPLGVWRRYAVARQRPIRGQGFCSRVIRPSWDKLGYLEMLFLKVVVVFEANIGPTIILGVVTDLGFDSLLSEWWYAWLV